MGVQKSSLWLKRGQLAAHRFSREQRGDTAIEFALIGSVFFLFVFGFFVISLDQYVQMTLDDAVRTVARQVSIGAITPASTPNFATAVCNEFSIVAPSCTTELQYSIVGGTGFSSTPDGTSTIVSLAATLGQNGLTGPAVVTGNSTLPPFTGVAATTPPQPPSQAAPSPPIQGVPRYIYIQVAYPAPLNIFPLLGASFGTENGTAYLYSAVAAVSEP